MTDKQNSTSPACYAVLVTHRCPLCNVHWSTREREQMAAAGEASCICGYRQAFKEDSPPVPPALAHHYANRLTAVADNMEAGDDKDELLSVANSIRNLGR